MNKLILTPAICLAWVCASASTSAQTMSDRTTHNVRCLIALSTLAASKTQNIQTAGLMGSLFFAGAVFGDDPNIDLSAALKSEVSKMRAEDLNVLVKQCGAEMESRGKEITAAGKTLDTILHLDRS